MENLILLTPILVYLNVALQLGDAISTYFALKYPGTSEGNPILKPILDKLGVVPGLLLVKGILIGLFIYFGFGLHPGILALFALPFAYITYQNTMIIVRKKRMGIKPR